MDVREAIEALQTVGQVMIEKETIRTRLPRSRPVELQNALQIVRENKDEALTILRHEEKLAAARAFVNRAGARLVCPRCWPECPSQSHYSILVPAANADEGFYEALSILELDSVPVFPRKEPLDGMGCPRLTP